MVDITAAQLAKLSATCSGHALKLAVDGTTPQDISKALDSQEVKHRVLDAQDINILDDKLATVVSGMEKLSQTEFVCFVSKMDSLRFRNILIFPTKLWFEAEECELTFWDRMLPEMREKFRNRVTCMDLEGF